MAEQTLTKEIAPKSKAIKILRQVFIWGVLALLLVTVIMAVYRKFGG
jgi:hypothetical protein